MSPSTNNAFDALVERFKKFPGIGPRQASRFVYYLLSRGKPETNSLVRELNALHTNIRQCIESRAYFYSNNPQDKLSPIAQNPNRKRDVVMVVERDSDLKAIEDSGVFSGQYFVLGGTVPLMDKNPEKFVRGRELIRRVDEGVVKDGLTEVIVATGATTEGDHTASYIDGLLSKFKGLKVTHLGRGLSTGTELEYVDRDTIQNALRNRK